MEPCISVIIPMYNVEAYLRRCLDSVIMQTYKNLEIIVIDDGSPDNCGKIADEYAAEDKRFKVIHQKNQGISQTRNVGIKAATGEWIFFVDSDDEIPKDAIRTLWEVAKREKVSMSMGSYMVCIPQKEKSKQKKVHVHNNVFHDTENMYKYFLSKGKNFNYLWMKLYRREIFETIRFEKGRYYEDILIFPDIIEAAGSIAVVDIPVYYYHLRYNSITYGSDMQNHMDGLYAREVWKQRMKEKYPQLIPYSADAMLEFCCYLMGKLSLIGRKNNQIYWKQVTDTFRENQSLATKNTLYLKIAVFLFGVSPVLLGKLCNIYSQLKNC